MEKPIGGITELFSFLVFFFFYSGSVAENDVLCDITAEEFRQQLDSKRPSRVRTGSGCAFDDGDEGPPLQVHPKDLVLLESIGPVAGRHQKKKKKKKKTAMARRRTSSETSLDESKIQATIEKAERELAIVSAGMAILHSPEEMPDRPFIPAITLQGASQPYVSGDHDDDDIIDEMFECELQEIDDTVESSIQLRDMSPAYRSNSVGGNTELRKRNRNWSGTATSLCAVSPSSCQRLKNLGLSPVVSKTAISSDEESSQPNGKFIHTSKKLLIRQCRQSTAFWTALDAVLRGRFVIDTDLLTFICLCSLLKHLAPSLK